MVDNLFFKKKGEGEFHPLDIPTRSLFASDRPRGLPVHNVVESPLQDLYQLKREVDFKFETTCDEQIINIFVSSVRKQLDEFREKVNLMSYQIIQTSDKPIRGKLTKRKLRKWHYKGQCFVQDMDGQIMFVGIRRGDDVLLCDGRIVKFVEYKRMLTYGKIRHSFAK